MNEVTLADLEHKYIELATMAQNFDSMNKNVAQGEGALAVAETLGASERITEIGQGLKEAREAQSKTHDLLAKRTGKPTIDGILSHIQDIGIRLDNARKLQQGWLQMRANFELALQVGEFAAPEARASAEGQLQKAKHTFETALVQLDRLFVRVSLLLPA